jgi:asparagine synthase (glutamine-hydrolysing)
VAEEWFVVLPDSDTALAAADALRPVARRVIEHASGRPWLMGHWPDGAVTVARAGRARLVVAGDPPATTGSLRERLRAVRTVDDAGAVVEGLPGCFHLSVSVAGRTRVQGSLASVRRVLRARVGEAVVAADNARVLALLAGAGWDPQWLALRLGAPSVPYPLQESTPWRGVSAVPGGHWLALEADGTAREHLHWSPPEPALSRAEGAVAVREALADAVHARVSPGGTVSCDLSGGMDSTSLAFLAADGPARLVTYRWGEQDPGNDDAFYARLAAESLPGVRHVVEPAESSAALSGGPVPDAPLVAREEPGGWVRIGGRLAHIARSMADEGSRLHLGGHGGDELFRPGSTYLYDLLRARPVRAVRHLRAVRVLGRLPRRELLRAMAERHTPAEELLRHADGLHLPPRGPRTVHFGWTLPPRLPPWATDDAVESARAVLRAAAGAEPQPLARQRAQHHVLLLTRWAGTVVRQASAVGRAVGGPPLAAPYLDDQVVTAALSVRLEERYSPWEFKPLLGAAMRDTVPDALLARTTKAEFGADAHLALRRQRAELLELFDGSELARYGLVDDAEIREALLRPHAGSAFLPALDATLACERWLRAVGSSGGADPFAPLLRRRYGTPSAHP